MQCQPSKQTALNDRTEAVVVCTNCYKSCLIYKSSWVYVCPNLPDVYRVRHQIQNRKYGKILEKSATNSIAGFIQQISLENQQMNQFQKSTTK